MVIQAAITFGLLKLSAHNLSPVKNTKRREKAYQLSTMKNIGVQPDVPIPGPAVQSQAPVPPVQEAQPQAPIPPTPAAQPQAPVPPVQAVQSQDMPGGQM